MFQSTSRSRIHKNVNLQDPEVVTEAPGPSSDTVIAMPPPPEAEENKAKSDTAIPLPPPDETTALNQGDKKAYNTPGSDQLLQLEFSV